MEVILPHTTYASGAKRLLAFIIDRLLLHTLFSILFIGWFFGSPWDWEIHNFSFSAIHLGFRFIEYHFITQAVIVLYYSFMESSKYQGTLGKIALGMRVTDVHGAPINFSKALLRNLSKYLSAILFIGYIMIIFDERKQGLHDKIADTLVVNQ